MKSLNVDFSRFTDDGVFAIFIMLVSCLYGDSVDVVDDGGGDCSSVTGVSELKFMFFTKSDDASMTSSETSFFL